MTLRKFKFSPTLFLIMTPKDTIIKDINPKIDDWDTSMLSKFDNKQLICALHNSLDNLYESVGIKGLGKLTRLFFNSIIIEIQGRMSEK